MIDFNQLAAIGMLTDIKVGREKLFLHPNFVRLLASDDFIVLPTTRSQATGKIDS